LRTPPLLGAFILNYRLTEIITILFFNKKEGFMEILKVFEATLLRERRTKKWFVEEYCKDMSYSAVNLQLLGYNNLSDKVKSYIKNFIEDSK